MPALCRMMRSLPRCPHGLCKKVRKQIKTKYGEIWGNFTYELLISPSCVRFFCSAFLVAGTKSRNLFSKLLLSFACRSYFTPKFKFFIENAAWSAWRIRSKKAWHGHPRANASNMTKLGNKFRSMKSCHLFIAPAQYFRNDLSRSSLCLMRNETLEHFLKV